MERRRPFQVVPRRRTRSWQLCAACGTLTGLLLVSTSTDALLNGPSWPLFVTEALGCRGRGSSSTAATARCERDARVAEGVGSLRRGAALVDQVVEETSPAHSRRSLAAGSAAAACAALLAAFGGAGAVRAVVTGNRPPDSYGFGKNVRLGKAKCIDKEDCQEKGADLEVKEFGAAKDIKYEKTSSGVRYKDMTDGVDSDGVAKAGDIVRLRYRVMRSGKRSSDGLSGEASTIFSLGFGEDDGPKDAVLTAAIGEGKFVKALDEGLVGMAVGGTRRVQVRPENGLGWRRAGKCAEESQAVGMAAGLPMGGTANEETCLIDTLLPQPLDYGSKRRFSRRFDESLIVEVELVGLGAA